LPFLADLGRGTEAERAGVSVRLAEHQLPTSGEVRRRKGSATVIDFLLRQAEASRAGAQGDHDYDVIGHDGMVIGRIFKAAIACGDALDVDAGLRRSRDPNADPRLRGNTARRYAGIRWEVGQRDVTAPALRQGLA